MFSGDREGWNQEQMGLKEKSTLRKMHEIMSFIWLAYSRI